MTDEALAYVDAYFENMQEARRTLIEHEGNFIAIRDHLLMPLMSASRAFIEGDAGTCADILNELMERARDSDNPTANAIGCFITNLEMFAFHISMRDGKPEQFSKVMHEIAEKGSEQYLKDITLGDLSYLTFFFPPNIGETRALLEVIDSQVLPQFNKVAGTPELNVLSVKNPDFMKEFERIFGFSEEEIQ